MPVRDSSEGVEQWPSLSQIQKAELVERYKLLLLSKRRVLRYVAETASQIQKLLALTRSSIDEDSLLGALADLRQHGMSVRTTNKYTVSLKSFTTWLTRRGYFPFNPLQFVPILNAKLDRRYERTVFTDQELAALLTTTRASPYHYKGITGPERSELYHCAAATGLREHTLTLLETGQFELDGPQPCVRVRAEQVKDADDLNVPIQKDSADQLRKFLRDKPPRAKAFRTPLTRWDFIRMLRRDMLAAGITPSQDEVLPNGRIRRRQVKDFHSLRHFAATWWQKNQVPLATAQRWLGHSDPALTANFYTHQTPPDTMAAVARLPPLPGVPLADYR